jgi:hypothetical protein
MGFGLRPSHTSGAPSGRGFDPSEQIPFVGTAFFSLTRAAAWVAHGRKEENLGQPLLLLLDCRLE